MTFNQKLEVLKINGAAIITLHPTCTGWECDVIFADGKGFNVASSTPGRVISDACSLARIPDARS